MKKLFDSLILVCVFLGAKSLFALDGMIVQTDRVEKSRLISGLIRIYQDILEKEKDNIALRRHYAKLLEEWEQKPLLLKTAKELESLDPEGKWGVKVKDIEKDLMDSGRPISPH